jgi:crotonobetainyl-CoA:carnitine CoA-transferase CaiB-like acyl-CoA transferase
VANGPLHGIKVLDLSRVLAGPWASQLLADYGADVIKVERPDSGDDTRHWGPPWVPGKNGEATSESAYFQSANRNKRSITVNLKHEHGQKVVRALCAKSDVLIENYKVGDLKRFGLDAKTLCEINPALIYCSISAYGQDSSRSNMPGYDAMIQASAGLMSITGPNDEDGGGPQKVGVAIADIMAGMYAVTAILAALHERSVSGKGQSIDIPLYDSQVAWLANQNMNYLFTGEPPVREGTGHPNIVPYQAFDAADTPFVLAVGSDTQFRACAKCLELPDLADDPRFHSNSKRVENRQALIELMAQELARKPARYWLRLFNENNVPAGPINSIETVLTEEYASERGLVQQLPHPLAGEVPTVANPVTFSYSETVYERAPPLLGEHTQSILADELSYSQESIDELKKNGVI